MAQQPRALVLAEDDRIVVIKRLARAVLKFQDKFLDRESSPAGLLCQVSSALVGHHGLQQAFKRSCAVRR